MTCSTRLLWRVAKGDMGLAVATLAPDVVATAVGLWGTEEQQRTYLPSFTGSQQKEGGVPAAALALNERWYRDLRAIGIMDGAGPGERAERGNQFKAAPRTGARAERVRKRVRIGATGVRRCGASDDETVKNGSNMASVMSVAEMCWGGVGLTLAMPRQGLGDSALAADEQFERFNGTWASMAITEPGSGSDSAQFSTTATKDGDEYALNGELLERAGIVIDYERPAVVQAAAAAKFLELEADREGRLPAHAAGRLDGRQPPAELAATPSESGGQAVAGAGHRLDPALLGSGVADLEPQQPQVLVDLDAVRLRHQV